MTLRIVGIHGVGNHRPRLASAAQRIGRLWSEALRSNLLNGIEIDLRIAYYATHLHTELAQDATDGLDWLPEGEYELLRAWAGELGALPADVAQATWSIPARMIADRMAEHKHLSPAVVRPFVATFLREVGSYLRPGALARPRIRELVAEEIRAHRPHIVIAHSLGSVVGYETLWAHADLQVDLLITIGSPLGMKTVVFDRLQPRPCDGRGARPPNIKHWVNIADPGDIVAVPRPFTLRFTPDANYDDCHIHWADFHSAGRYLASLRTIETINTYLEPCSNSAESDVSAGQRPFGAYADEGGGRRDRPAVSACSGDRLGVGECGGDGAAGA
jgi:hypothetical protein